MAWESDGDDKKGGQIISPFNSRHSSRRVDMVNIRYTVCCILLFLCQLQAADSDCQFGVGCIFPCHCKGEALCNTQTGVCPNGCDDGQPDGTLLRAAFTGPACQVGNVAFMQEARQLATFNDDEVLYGAGNAVDGNLNQVSSQGSCAYVDTTANQQAWWQVDLDDTYVVENVVIINRRDGNTDYLPDTIVQTKYRTDGYSDCGTTGSAMTDRINVTMVTCIPPRPATKVRLIRDSSAYNEDQLVLCEVTVNAFLYRECENGYFGPGCLQTCNCQVACRYWDGYCPGLCIIGFTSYNCQDACEDGSWGEACTSKCNCADPTEVCDKQTGECMLSGCAEGYMTPSCQLAIPNFLLSVEVLDLEAESALLKITYLGLVQTRSNLAGASSGGQLQEPALYIPQWSVAGSTRWHDGGRLQETGQDNYVYRLAGLEPDTSYVFRVIPVVLVDDVEYRLEPSATTYPSDPVSTSTTGNKSAAIAMGVVFALVVIAGSIVLVIFLWRRRRQRESMRQALILQQLQTVNAQASSSGVANPSSSGDGQTTGAPARDLTNLACLPPQGAKLHPITAATSPMPDITESCGNIHQKAQDPVLKQLKLDQLEEHVKDTRAKRGGFADEFKILPAPELSKCNGALRKEVQAKNRSQSALPYDHTRVILKSGKHPVSAEEDDTYLRPSNPADYINASYIRAYKDKPRGYIGCQGPLPGTVDDMWHLIWQENVNRVVMLTNLVEDAQVMCERYWPDKVAVYDTDIRVELTETSHYADFVIRRLAVTRAGEGRTVRHYQFTGWPRGGVPATPTSLLNFRHKLRQDDGKRSGPFLVHSSDGVGRTGVFLAIDYELERASSEGAVDILQYVAMMRADRMNMVQTQEQYSFIYDVLIEAYFSGNMSTSFGAVKKVYAVLLSEAPAHSSIVQEYQILEKLKRFPRYDGCAGCQPQNRDKNRSKEIIPRDCDRPIITPADDSSGDYINAVFVDGYGSRCAYLVTQMPLWATMSDFWRMIHEQKSSTIAMLTDPAPADGSMPVFWPQSADESMKFGELNISRIPGEEVVTDDITIRQFIIHNTDKPSQGGHMVRQFCYTAWSDEHSTPSSRGDLLRLLDLIHSWLLEVGVASGPVTVMCSDGVGRCGLLVAASLVMEKMRMDQEVDIFQVVKLVRRTRPQLIVNQEQYRCLYEIVLKYVTNYEKFPHLN